MGKKSIVVFFILFAVICKPVFGEGILVKDLYLYIFQSSELVTVKWTTASEATAYDFYLFHTEHKEKALSAKIPQPTSGDTATFNFKSPRSGHYELFLRSVREPLSESFKAEIDKKTSLAELKQFVYSDTSNVCDAEIWWKDTATLATMKQTAKNQKGTCSKYINSKVDGVATDSSGVLVKQGWWLYFFPAAPTGGSITME